MSLKEGFAAKNIPIQGLARLEQVSGDDLVNTGQVDVTLLPIRTKGRVGFGEAIAYRERVLLHRLAIFLDIEGQNFVENDHAHVRTDGDGTLPRLDVANRGIQPSQSSQSSLLLLVEVSKHVLDGIEAVVHT